MVKRNGRPTKLTRELSKKICDLIRQGNYPEVAAGACGVARSTFYNWKKKGREAKRKTRYRDFLDDIKEAEEYSQAVYLERILEAAQGDEAKGTRPIWQAAAWYLERKFPDKWGKKERHQIEHKGELKQEIKQTLTVKELYKQMKEDLPENERCD